MSSSFVLLLVPVGDLCAELLLVFGAKLPRPIVDLCECIASIRARYERQHERFVDSRVQQVGLTSLGFFFKAIE